MTGIGSIGGIPLGGGGGPAPNIFTALAFPLAFPGVCPASGSFRLSRVVSSSRSEFTLAQQVYKFPGSQWSGEVTFPPLTLEKAGIVTAFLSALDGSAGTFLYGDPLNLAAGNRGSHGGTPVADGALQTGDTLNIKGCAPNIEGWGKAGDYFQIGTGLLARLHKLIQDVDTNRDGKATLNFKPALRYAPADLQPLIFDSPMGVMRLSGNAADWAEETGKWTRIGFSYQEYIPQ